MVDFVSLFTGMSERDIGYLLKTMVQQEINSELTNADISETDDKTPVLITISNDVELQNDIAIQSAINLELDNTFLMAEEPDGQDLKLWLKFQNAGELIDWSCQKNKSYSTGANTMPGLFSKFNENSMLKYELYSYFNGNTHYAYTEDAPPVQIKPNIVAGKVTSFFMRLLPISLSKLLYTENNSPFTKTDDDQLRYGYSVIMDGNGSINFYIKNDYRQYHIFLKDAYNYILTDPLYNLGYNFRFEDFNKRNFLTGFEFLCGLVAAQLPFHDWFFKYNPTSHAMTIIQTSEDNLASIYASTATQSWLPYLSCPVQEGKWTHSGTVQGTIYDNSGHGNNGTVSGYTTGGNWNDDNTLSSTGPDSTGGLAIDWGVISSLDTLTEFTVSFWYNPLNELINNKSYNTRLFSKGYAIANSIYIERNFGVNDLKFSIRGGDNIEQSVTFTNPFAVEDKWYCITIRWKSGEKLKLAINNIEVLGSSNVTTTLNMSGNNIKLYNATRAPIGNIALFKMDNIQITDIQRDNILYEGYHNPLFPKSENIQPEAGEEQPPIFVDFSNIYTADKPTSPVIADYRKINSLAGDSPLIERYNVADGTSVTDPELNPYTILDGVSTGGGSTTFTSIYTATDAGNSSSELSGATGNERTVVEIQSGSTMIGKKVTKAIFYLRGDSTPTGTVKCKVWNASGTEITSLWLNGTLNTNLNAASVNTSTHTAYTFINTDITPWGANNLAVGWKIGIEYNDGGSDSDAIMVKRNRANVRPNEWNNNYDGSWDTTPDDDDLVADLYEGGTGTPVVDPWVIMKSGSYNKVTQTLGAGDVLIGKLIGKATFRIRKSGSPTGTATIAIMNNSTPPVIKATLGTFNVSTDLTTSFQDITRSNYTHGYQMVSADRVGIIWTPSASGEVHVMTNIGNTGGGNTWNGNNSAATRYISSWNTITGADLAGKIYTGGNNFDAFLAFSATRTRITEKAVNTASSLNNRKISKIVMRARKVGAPSGIINCYIRDVNDVIKVTFSSVDVSTIGTSFGDVVFENYTHTYLINSGTLDADKVSFEYSSADGSNYVELNSNKDVIDTLNSIVQTYDSGNYVDNAQRDLAGKMYEGGQPDLNSRTRVAQSIEHQDSRLKGKKITRVNAYLIKTGTASGTCYCNIRNSNDSLIKTLNTVSVSGLSATASAPTFVPFEDTTNNYPMNVGDKVCIEFSGGDSSNQVGVLVRQFTPNYDGVFSFIRKFDEFDWDDSESTYDLCGTMEEGGFSYTPDPDSIQDPTPVNDKDLIYAAGNNKLSGFLECFLMEFRIYSKDITLDQADFLYENRYTISPIAPNQLLMPFTLRPTSLDPV